MYMHENSKSSKIYPPGIFPGAWLHFCTKYQDAESKRGVVKKLAGEPRLPSYRIPILIELVNMM